MCYNCRLLIKNIRETYGHEVNEMSLIKLIETSPLAYGGVEK